MLGRLLLLKRHSFTYSAQGRERSRLEATERFKPSLVRQERRRLRISDEDKFESLADSIVTEKDVESGKKLSSSSEGRKMLGKVLEGCSSLGLATETRWPWTRADEGRDTLETPDFIRGLAASCRFFLCWRLLVFEYPLAEGDMIRPICCSLPILQSTSLGENLKPLGGLRGCPVKLILFFIVLSIKWLVSKGSFPSGNSTRTVV